MAFDDVVNPAKTGVTNAKHGGGVILTPGVPSNQYQAIDAGVAKPVAEYESRLNNRFDDIDYYMDLPVASVQSQTLSPTVATNLGDFEISWNNVNNVLTSNDSYTTGSMFLSGPETDTLRASTFGFTVPSLAVVKGIVVEIERKASVPGVVIDAEITIRKGTTNSNNKSIGAVWSTTESYVSYGGAADLWGLTLTPDEVNASTFAVNIRAGNATGDPGIASIDHVRVTVYYQ